LRKLSAGERGFERVCAGLRRRVFRDPHDLVGQRGPVAQMEQRHMQMLGQDQRAREAVLALEAFRPRMDPRRRHRIRQAGEEDPLLLRRTEFPAPCRHASSPRTRA
jgi:hypothetical protein